MNEYKYISIVINKFDLPLEIKLAMPDSDLIDQKKIDETIKQISEKVTEYEQIFSLENNNSLLACFQNGDESGLMTSPEFREVYEQTITAEQMTHHYFSSYFNSQYDPIGLLNGWIIDKIFNKYLLSMLSNNGIDGVSLRSGEDVRLASRPNIDFRWRVAVKDPQNLDILLATYFLQNGAISTSNKRRGLRNEKSNIEQVTIVSSNALDANIWSSAGISAGTNKFPEFVSKYHLTGMIVDSSSGMMNFRDGYSDKIAVQR
ncbi:FAD:protein FMN transferase [Companilactobacillus crustorum]|uniref:FAD:protein FMN transferase n=1 Tax=Companilactobacillus crustorum TaxID=392416 RepID=UPI00096A6C72|nr:FAD:protein FMN transferase [Companilactobacillus crustorum]